MSHITQAQAIDLAGKASIIVRCSHDGTGERPQDIQALCNAAIQHYLDSAPVLSHYVQKCIEDDRRRAALAQPAKAIELNMNQDNALCEAQCNGFADKYFAARPQLDSAVNRRIFCAGHRYAWLEAKAVQPAEPTTKESLTVAEQSAELDAEIEAIRADAGRYRHLRSEESRDHKHYTTRCMTAGVHDWAGNFETPQRVEGPWSTDCLTGKALDQAIDSAIAAKEE